MSVTIPNYPKVQGTLKDDAGKRRWSLLPWDELGEVADIMTEGCTAPGRYDGSWKDISNHRDVYYSAAMRHITAWWGGEKWAPDSKRHHLAHAVCNLLFLIWFDHHEKSSKAEDSGSRFPPRLSPPGLSQGRASADSMSSGSRQSSLLRQWWGRISRWKAPTRNTLTLDQTCSSK